jgi:hypothetical protein
MSKCAVVIGVNKTGGLPILAAAVSGAKDFADWTKSQKITTTLLTDEKKPVTINDIKKAVKKYVDSKTYSQLILFFAGHGVLKGPNDEHWLLTNAPNDPNEAVNVSASKYLAFNTGIPHIVFISDACRSIPSNPLITQISGAVVFPNVQPGRKQPDIDMFYATKPGDAAYEVKDEKEASKNYKGIFTHCMLEGLTGKAPKIICQVTESNKSLPVVFPYELKLYLEERVPLAAQEVKITLTQDPRIEVTSRPPNYLSKIAVKTYEQNGKKKKGPAPAHITPQTEKLSKSIDFIKNYHATIKETINTGRNKLIDKNIDAELKKLTQATGKESFETQTGFTIIGTKTFEIVPTQNRKGKVFETFLEKANVQVRVFPETNVSTLLFITADGTGIPLAVLPGFIGTVLVENNRVININYIPSRNSNRYREFQIKDKQVIQRRAAVALAVRNGAFQIKGDRYSIMETASYLRHQKSLDPTLGLYAAYAYAQIGNNIEIKSIFDYMRKEREPILFDVKLLAALNNKKDKKIVEKTHAPFCPILTQGWSYLQINEKIIDKKIKDLNKHLIPGLWTTFTPEGVHYIKERLLNFIL